MNKQTRCADRIEESWQGRRDDLAILYRVDGEYTPARALEYLDGLGYNVEDMTPDPDRISEAIDDAQGEYGLCFEAVETKAAESDGVVDVEAIEWEVDFYRFQISTGGPAEEVRFWLKDPLPTEGEWMDRAEFAFLDWGDIATRDITNDPVALAVFNFWCDTYPPLANMQRIMLEARFRLKAEQNAAANYYAYPYGYTYKQQT